MLTAPKSLTSTAMRARRSASRSQPVQQRRLAGAEEAADDGRAAVRASLAAHGVSRAEHAARRARCPTTRTSFSASGRRASGSSSRTQKSARLPHSMQPISSSSFSVQAAPSVIARSASATVMLLARAEHAARRREPVDRAPGGEQRPERRDRRVGVDRQRHAGGERAWRRRPCARRAPAPSSSRSGWSPQ